MQKFESLSIIIPAYKAENVILDSIKATEAVLKNIAKNYEIICVVDGEMDNTYEIASDYSKKKKNIYAYQYKKNRGKGYAVRFGLDKAKGNVVGFIDAGADIDPKSLINLWKIFNRQNADIVIGSKRHPESNVIYPKVRRLISNIYFFAIKSLFGLKVGDTQAGIKIFKKQVYSKVKKHLKINSFAFDIEFLGIVNSLGYDIKEAPIIVNMVDGPKSLPEILDFTRLAFRMFVDTGLVFFRLKVIKSALQNND